MPTSDARKRAILDSQFGAGATPYAPGTWYAALSTTVPNADGSNFVEPSGGAYARVARANDATNWPAAVTTGGVTLKRNGTKVTFANPTGTWGTVRYLGLFTASSGGTPDYFGEVKLVLTIQSGNTPVEFDVSALEISL